ncbi:MAG: HAD-IIB family hydrolase [Thiolinea sp.]
MQNPNNWLIFTDLDGTLLDHHTYSHAAAQPALDALRRHDIPVILNSSKTAAEMATLAERLQLDAPRITENGSVIVYPDGRVITLGSDYTQLCSVLDELRSRHHYRFSGFHHWSTRHLANVTGLSLEAAALAQQRQASEPLLWLDDEERLEQFRRELEAHDLSLKRGGRFWHVMGQTDKVTAMLRLRDEYAQEYGQRPSLIALGDGPNDRDMLATADIAVIVYNPEGVPPELPAAAPDQRLIRTTLPGPAGWNAALLTLLEETAGSGPLTDRK